MTRASDQTVALDPHATYEAEEVALVVFHVTVKTFRRRLKKLRAEGFPSPISRWGTKLWSGQSLIAWQNRDRTDQADVIPFTAILVRRARNAAWAGARKRPA